MSSALTFNRSDDRIVQTYEWLNADKAAAIAAILKQHGATVQRLAQKRGTLGVCKLVATFQEHSWAATAPKARDAKQAVIAAGLTDSLTF
jgi:hypothetical protein